MSVKRDNSNLAEKIVLRTRILRQNFEPLRVLETCAGEGVLWRQLHQEFKVASYTPCDRAPRMPGCIKMEMDDRHLNAFDLASFNVIDIDPHGDPWAAYINLSKRIVHRTAFFITHGAARTVMGGGATSVSKPVRLACGIPGDWDIPKQPNFVFWMGYRVLQKSLVWLDIDYCLMASHLNVRYIGLIARPKQLS